MTLKAAVVGKSGRNHAIACSMSGRLNSLKQALLSSPKRADVYVVSDVYNTRLAPRDHLYCGKTDDPAFVADCMKQIKPDLVVIGPEEPLAAGIADMLAEM